MALGETYEKLEKWDNAIKCYKKAVEVGDIEGIATYKMANIYEKLGTFAKAVICYERYCNTDRSLNDKQSYYHGLMTLATYYESQNEFGKASFYAYKCMESEDVCIACLNPFKFIQLYRLIVLQ